MIKTWGENTVKISNPEGYYGLFWGRVYDQNGKCIYPASDYFMKLAEEKKIDTFHYWDTIYELIDAYCKKHITPLVEDDDDDKYHYQSGFGGDECDGLIDFWLPKQVPDLPDMPFTIDGTSYVLKWVYAGDDEDNEDE